MNQKTSGVFNLQEKRAEHLVASVISGIDESGNAFVRFKFYPKVGVLWLPSAGTLGLRHDLAFEMVGLVHVLLATLIWLGGPEFAVAEQRGTDPTVRAVGSPRHRTFECHFDQSDALRLVEEPDGLCTLDLSARLAEQLAHGLAAELGRIAAWLPDSREEEAK